MSLTLSDVAKVAHLARLELSPAELQQYQGQLSAILDAVARLEANFPIGLPEEYGIKGGLFVDIGSLWGLDRASVVPISETVGLASTTMQMRVVAGFSIFWETPVGPLRFNFMSNLRGPSYDQTENFSLAIGTRF